MPNLVYHSVWDLSPTLSVGNNPLFESSYIEQFGSGRSHRSDGVPITEKLDNSGLDYLEDVRKQINEQIMKNNILSYKPPKVKTSYGSLCLDEEYYDFKLLKKILKRKNKSPR